MASPNAGPITGSELIPAVQGNQRIFLTRPQVAALFALQTKASDRPYDTPTSFLGTERFYAVQGGQAITLNGADLVTFLAASGIPDPVAPALQPTTLTGTERLLGAQSLSRVAFSVAEAIAVRDGGAPPLPSFTINPTINPNGGNVGATFTAADGLIANGIFASRRWLLSGTAIGTGTTVVPNAAGSLVLEVTATRADGSGGVVATSVAVTVSAAATAPAAPTLSATPAATQNTISFTNGSNGGSPITSRKLYRSTTSGFTPGAGNLIATNPTFPYVDTGLTNGTTYYYKGIATNAVGDSAASAQVSGTPSVAMIATSTSDFASKMAAANAGDTILLADGVAFGTLSNFKSGVTVQGQTTKASHSVENIYIVNAQNVTLRGIRIQSATDFRTALFNTPKLLSISGNVDGLIIDNNLIRGGYPGEGFADYDVTADYSRYPEFGEPGGTFATVTGSVTDGTLTVTATTSGNIRVGDIIRIGTASQGIIVTSFGTGTGGVGTYNVARTNGSANTTAITSQTLKLGGNTIGSYSPYAIGMGVSGSPYGNITIMNNTISDVGQCIKFGYGGAGKLIIANNDLIRAYQDFIAVGYSAGASPGNGIEVVGNLFQDAFAQPQDNLNPHGDMVQIYGADDVPGSTYNYPIPGVLIAGNISFQSPGARGEPQRPFLSDIYHGYPFLAPVIVDNLFISRITNKGISISNIDDATGTPTGAAYAYIYRNNILTNPTNNFPIGNESTTNNLQGTTGISDSTVSTIVINNDADYPSTHFVDGNFYEAINAPSAVTGALGNILTPKGANASSYSTWFAADASTWSSMTTPASVISAFTPISTYANIGPVRNGDTLAAFRARWVNPGTRPYSSLPSFAGFINIIDQPMNTQVMSNWAYVHSFENRSISITNGEYQIADDKNGTNATAWLTASGTIANGKYVRLRQTTATTGVTGNTTTLTIGSQSMTWTTTTASARIFPTVTFDGNDRFARPTNTGLGPSSQKGTIAILGFKASSPPAASVSLYGGTGGVPRVNLQLLATGQVRLTIADGSGTISRMETTGASIYDGNPHDLFFSWDFAQTVESNGRSVIVDGVNRSLASTAYDTTGTRSGDYSYALTTYAFGGIGTQGSTSMFNGTIGAFYMNIAERADVTTVPGRSKFSGDMIGTNGTGPTGTQPHTLLVGNATQWNAAGGINFGSGGAYTAVSGAAVTDAVGGQAAWS